MEQHRVNKEGGEDWLDEDEFGLEREKQMERHS